MTEKYRILLFYAKPIIIREHTKSKKTMDNKL